MNEILDNDNNKRKLRKITCEWDEKNTKKLIKCVKNHRILWDPKNHDYKNRAMRELEWKIISNEIFLNETSSGEVCTKWQNLRSQFHNYRKKYKRGCNNNKNIRWKYFNMLQFLPAPVYIIPQLDSKNTDIKLEIPFEEQNNSDCNISIEAEPSSDKNIAKKNILDNSIQEYIDTVTDSIPNSIINSPLHSDEYSDFGRFVANELRNLKFATDLQSKLKRQIQRHIVDIADEHAFRLNSGEHLKHKKYDNTTSSSSATSLLATSITLSSASDCYTECKLEVED